MSTVNPYIPPQGKVEDRPFSSEEFGVINILSSKGRLGRLRYFSYSFGISIAGMVVFGLIAALLSMLPSSVQSFAMGALMIPGYLVLTVVLVMLGIQRLHDIGKSGWYYLLMIIPILGVAASLWMMFWPGSKVANAYGPPPPPTKSGLLWVIIILGMVVMLGIIAAIAIPAYSDFVARAAAMQPN